ncbi:MAG: nucleoside triphosphate pyrophosphohydrolase [Patescibacteria group bacterium]|jgi:predicted house-cleaning noncanonical NTP pyrophosphatase (MazG superfamily)
MVIFHKLVRDRIAKIIEKQGKKPVVHVATEEEYYHELKAKLIEEANEYIKSGDMEELADLLQVIYTICEYKNYPRETLEELRRKKNTEKGKFLDRIILDEVKE